MFPRQVRCVSWFVCSLCICCVYRETETLRFLGLLTLPGSKCPPKELEPHKWFWVYASLCASVYCHSWRIVCGKDVRVDLLPPTPRGSDPTNQRLSGHLLLLQHSSFSLRSTSDVRCSFSSFSTQDSIYFLRGLWWLVRHSQTVAVTCISMSGRGWAMLCGRLGQNYITGCVSMTQSCKNS